MPPREPVQAIWRGRVPYSSALLEMRQRREAVLAGDVGQRALILCEHPPVITCGRHANEEHVLLEPAELERRGIGLAAIERGGDVTYHGPGQLMIYPIVEVGVRIREFIEGVAGVLGELAASYGVKGASWQDREPGLWLGQCKLAACGLHLHRGVSIHGFAFNVCTPSDAWQCIVPCGLVGSNPISLQDAAASRGIHLQLSVESVAQRAEPRLLKFLTRYGLDHRE